jgi:hypothetical protein
LADAADEADAAGGMTAFYNNSTSTKLLTTELQNCRTAELFLMIDVIHQPVAGFRTMDDQKGGKVTERHVLLAFDSLPVVLGNNDQIHGFQKFRV